MRLLHKPEGYNAVSPYLLVKDVRAMLEFLSHAFGATELRRQPDAEGALRKAVLAVENIYISHPCRPDLRSNSLISINDIFLA